MAQQTINIGTVPNDGTGDTIRDSFDKANDNFTELYTTKANLASPSLTGTPTAPTAATATNTTQLATTAFVQNNKVSPAFTGTPTAPTAPLGTDTTQIATTAFVQDEIDDIPNATETLRGLVELSTTAEVTAGTNDTTAVTPLKLQQKIDSVFSIVGSMVGYAYATSDAMDSTTLTIPVGASAPTNTDGKEYAPLTTSYTASASTSVLEIEATFSLLDNSANNHALALFKDSTCIAAAYIDNESGEYNSGKIRAVIVVGDTSSHSYSVRFGPTLAGTVYIGGATNVWASGGRHNALTIKEIAQ